MDMTVNKANKVLGLLKRTVEIKNKDIFPGGGGGEYFRNFWVGMCRWDPGTLSLYQS